MRKNISSVTSAWLIAGIFFAVPAAHAEFATLSQGTNLEFGWNHSGNASWGSNWHAKARNVALEQIRKQIEIMATIKEFKSWTKETSSRGISFDFARGKESSKIKGDWKFEGGRESKVEWIKANNFIVHVGNVRIKPGTDWTKTSSSTFGGRRWEASATMLYDLQIIGPQTFASTPAFTQNELAIVACCDSLCDEAHSADTYLACKDGCFLSLEYDKQNCARECSEQYGDEGEVDNRNACNVDGCSFGFQCAEEYNGMFSRLHSELISKGLLNEKE